jgi:hypothetical protein
LNNFALALKNAGYSPPANKQNDPLVYSHWYSSANIDPFKVVKANSVEFANLSTGVVNARSSALLSVAVQGILECLKHKSFDKPTCKKLLRDHFIYFDFQHRAKKETGKKFNKQIETAKDKDSSIPWGEWMDMAKKFIEKVFYTSGAKEGELKKQPKSQSDYAAIRDAVIVATFSLLPITRLKPWDSTLVKPVGYEKGGEAAKDYLKINYVTPEGRAFFNDFKNYSSVYALADPPKNSPFEQPIKSELYKKILKTWIAVKPAGNPYLFPSNFKEGNTNAIALGTRLRALAVSIDPKKRAFGNRLMRRAYIKWVRTGNMDFDKNDVRALIQFMLSVHQTSPLVNMGYVKTSSPEEAIKKAKASSQEIFDSVLNLIEKEEGADEGGKEESATAAAPAAPKRRGRPPKKKVVESDSEDESSVSLSDSEEESELSESDLESVELPPKRKPVVKRGAAPAKRGRGRPRKT